MKGTDETDVVVVGAGLAGLVTAARLQHAGLSTVVLEATEHVGGRTRSQLIGNQILDVGGQLVGVDYVRVRRLAASLGLHLQPDARLPRIQLDPGAHPEVGATSLVELARLSRRMHRWCAELRPQAPWQTVEARRLDQLSLSEWLDSSSLGTRTARLLEQLIGAFALAPAERLSLLHVLIWLQPAGGLSGLWRETRWSIAEGAQELSRRLAERLTTPPVLGTPVAAIEQGTGHVTVHSSVGQRWNARRVALCLPLPTTRSITFTPELPDEQSALLAEISSPPVTKLIAAMNPAQPVSPLVRAGDPVLRLATRGTTYSLGFAYNDDAALPAERLQAHLLNALDLRADHFDGFAAHSWQDQPYARGGYPAFAPGQLSRHGPALRASHGRVHFAGADRSTWPGTMEGAVRDGTRVADDIQKALT